MLPVGCISTVGKERKMADNEKQIDDTKPVKKKKKLNKRQQQQRKLIVVGVEVLCLLLLLGAVYVWSLWNKIRIDGGFSNEEAGINEDLDADAIEKMNGYTNIALFGLDNRSAGNYGSGQSDVMMVASINNKTKEVRLLSLYRDTYLNIGNGKYNKANAAYNRGGAKQAVQMLNTNLDLNITEYVCVDWAAVTETIDALGGVEIELTKAEVKQINEYLWEVDKMLGTKSETLSGSGKKLLTGTQATTYARIRKTSGNDFKRSSRQRIVLEAMLNKAKSADVGTLLNICNTVFDDIATSLTLNEIIELASHVKQYTIGTTSGFPFKMTTKDISGAGDCVIPIGFKQNVSELHKYLFDTENYEPSNTVETISNTIIDKTGITENSSSINVDDFNDTAGQTGTDFKDETGTENK